MLIDSAFPGGNSVVDEIGGDSVHIHQDLRDTDGDWFYWAFRVRRAAGRDVTFTFTRGNPIGVRGPSVSIDGGRNWFWLGAESVRGNAFRYTFARDAGDVNFAFGIPYLETHLREFLARHHGNAHLIAGELCKTTRGRSIEMLRAGRLDGRCRHRVLLTARHHACEAVSSFALEGFLDAVLKNDELGLWYREQAEVLAVPFIDKDGVEDGDQGKNRKPHDHNRDYATEIYPSVRALRRLVSDWAGDNFHAALDFHCPWIRGGRNESIYFVGSPSALHWQEIGRFGKLLEQCRSGPLPFRAADNLPFGLEWNTYSGPLVTFQRWAESFPSVRLTSTLEIPYANVLGTAVSADAARAFGRDLAVALQQYLASLNSFTERGTTCRPR